MFDTENKDKNVEVPSFVESKDSDIDMSVFNKDEEDDEYYDEEDDGYGKRKLNAKVIVPIVIAVIALAFALAGVIFGFSQRSKYSELKKTYDEYVIASDKKVADLQAEVAALKTEIEAGKTGQVQPVENGKSVAYKITAEGGLNVRKGAGTSFDKVRLINSGTVVNVLETKQDGKTTWGRIGDNEWICLSLDGTAYATVNK